MNAWYFIALPGWIIVLITAAARLDDLGPNQWSLIFHVRRIGLASVGCIAGIMLATPFTDDAWLYEPTWRTAMFAWSWSLVWLTTENMPPWYDYILGVHRKTETWKGLGLRARMREEWNALRASFRPRRRRKPIAGPQGTLP